MVCVTYVELIGSPPHMRYLLRRIQQRFPHSPIVIGFWEPDDAPQGDRSAQGITGRTDVATSLHEAVRKCLEEAHKVELAEPAPSHEGQDPAADSASPVAHVAR
jgi:hypothetical protein